MDTNRAEPRSLSLLPAWTRPRLAKATMARVVARDLSAGTICALVTLSYAVSYGALIFSGELAPYLHAGMPALLVSCCVVGLAVAIGSSLRFAIAGPDSNAVAVLAGALAAIAGEMHAAGRSPASVIGTVLAALCMSSVATGVVALVLGAMRRGAVVQVLPFPVVGGFLAGTGFLILAGAFRVVTGAPLDATALESLQNAHPLAVVPCLGIAAALLGWTKLRQHPAGLPGAILAGTLGFHLAARAGALPREELLRLGLLFEPVDIGALSLPATLPVSLIDWAAIGSHGPALGGAVLVALLTVLLNAAGLEVDTGRKVDADRELRATGAANLLAGAAGGAIGYLSVSRTLLNLRAGATTRLAGVWAALLCLLVLTLAPELVGLLPRPVVAGLLVYLGVSMLRDWTITVRQRLSPHEYTLLLAILGTIVALGFPAGVALGLVAACILFAWTYARAGCVSQVFTGATSRSRIRRTVAEERVLGERGDATCGMALRGWLFFGSIGNIVRGAEELLRAPGRRSLLIDLMAVQGIDVSALLAFRRIGRRCRARGVTLIWIGLDATWAKALRNGGVLEDALLRFTDRDRALEHCENALLAEALSPTVAPDLRRLLAPHFAPRNLERLLFLLQPADLRAGAVVFAQGMRADALLFVESGQLSATAREGGRDVRAACYGPGTLVGETALSTPMRQPMDVVADRDTRIFRLTRAGLRDLERTSPGAALELKALLIDLLATRLALLQAESLAAAR